MYICVCVCVYIYIGLTRVWLCQNLWLIGWLTLMRRLASWRGFTHLHLPHPGTIRMHNYWTVYDSPCDLPFVCYTPYNISNSNIICRPNWLVDWPFSAGWLRGAATRGRRQPSPRARLRCRRVRVHIYIYIRTCIYSRRINPIQHIYGLGLTRIEKGRERNEYRYRCMNIHIYPAPCTRLRCRRVRLNSIYMYIYWFIYLYYVYIYIHI